MLRSMDEVTTQLSVPTTKDLISTILWKEKSHDRWNNNKEKTEDLKVSDHPLDQISSFHIPAEQFLSVGGFDLILAVLVCWKEMD